MFGRSQDGSSSSQSLVGAESTRTEVEITQVNESLYEFYKPPGTPTMEIVFFHGIYAGDLSDAHVTTWESGDGSCIWPQAWLVEQFPSAHLWTVSYCASVGKWGKTSHGNPDLYIIGENVVSDLMEANVGQTPNCPIVLVGYCFGGMVIKELCHQVSTRKNLTKHERERAKLQTFFDNVKAIFYYGTPHNGCPCLDKVKHFMESPLLEYFGALNKDRSRLNQHFDMLRTAQMWRIDGLGESLPAKSGVLQGVLVAPETNARQGDNFYVLPEDHFSINKPRSKKDRRFYALRILLESIAYRQEEVHQCQGLPRYSVDLERRALEVQQKLLDVEVLGLVGMGGIGKTALAKQLFNSISRDFEYTCFVDNVKSIPIHVLKRSLLEDFHHRGKKMITPSWLDLERKKTLIVMDDVDSEDQLKGLPQLKVFGVGSRMILTTRDEGILSFFEKYHIHIVDFLEASQAEKLFCAYAGLEEIVESSTRNHLKEISKAVVEKCGGLPLTLEVLGCYLRGHADDANYWKQTIDRLGKGEPISGGRNDRVWDTLRVSFDGLARKEQKMFIEAGIFSAGNHWT